MTDPSVSIILPIRNEGGKIELCLEAVRGQRYAGQMEILVVDGNSTDNTREVVWKIAREDDRIRLLHNPDRIVPTGMNIALREAKGEIIVRVDGHTIIAPDYIEKCVAALERTNSWNVGGRMNAIGVTPFGESVAIATSSIFGIGGGAFHLENTTEDIEVDTVYMGAWPAWVFDKVGWFDEELVRDQDDEFNYRLRAAGGKIILSREIQSTYEVRGAASKLWKQYYQYGYWKVRVLQKHSRQMSIRQFVPPLFVAGLASSVVLELSMLKLTWLFWFIAGSYLFANLVVSFITAKNRGWRHLLRLPIIYAILHLSYGSGFLAGLVKFWSRWGDKMGNVPSW